jgi:protein-tyrosine phosphatase
MSIDRHLDWDGCFNVRDLGGIRTVDGRTTRRGAVVRSDTPDRLSEAGWAALRAHGIRTIVDLRNDEERKAEPEPRAAGLTTVWEPLDDIADTDFWTYCRDNGLQGTPMYYRPFLEREGKARRCAAAVAAVANAEPGGVLVHCGIGRDRTGLISLLLLALVDAVPDDIVADYEVSNERLEPLRVLLGVTDERARLEAALARWNTTARDAILATLSSIDVAAYLRAAGLRDDELAAVRTRLLG